MATHNDNINVGVPMRLPIGVYARLCADAERDGISPQSHAAILVAQHYNVTYTPLSRGGKRTPLSPSERRARAKTNRDVRKQRVAAQLVALRATVKS